MLYIATLLTAVLCASPMDDDNLLVDGGFELGVVAACGQGILPDTWFQASVVVPGSDTWTEDCSTSEGVPFSAFGHFLSLPAAQEGLRFAAAWGYSGGSEALGTTLSAPLIAGKRYRLTGYYVLSEILPNDFPGYEIWFSDNDRSGDPDDHYVGLIGDQPGSGWTFDCLEFVAPSGAGQNLILYPQAMGSNYIGVDNLRLVLVDDEPLALEASSSEVVAGDPVTFNACGGGAGAPLLFAVVEVNGTFLFRSILVSAFDSSGSWEQSLPTPPALSGFEIDFQLYGVVPAGFVGASDATPVEFL